MAEDTTNPAGTLANFLASKKTSKPGVLRKAAGAVTEEALRGTGRLGRAAVSHVRGDNLTHSTSRANSRTSASASAEKVDLSKTSTPPKDSPIGIAKNTTDVEKQVVKLDAEIKSWGKWTTNEFTKVRSDIKNVFDMAKSAKADVEKLRKDFAEEEFRKRVLAAQLKQQMGSGSKFASGGAGTAARSDAGLTEFLSKYGPLLVEGLEGAGVVAGGLLAKSKIGRLLGRKALTKGGVEAAEALSKPAIKAGTEAATEAATSKISGAFAGRVAKSIIKGKGGAIGTGIDILQTMKQDSQSGNPMRTWLRSKLGIEDPGEAAPWAGAMSNDEYTAAKKAGTVANKARKAGDSDDDNGDNKASTIDSEGDVVISSKKNVSLKAVQDITLEARNELTLKARVITLDADELNLKGAIHNTKLGGAGTASPGTYKGTYSSGYTSGSPNDQRFQEYVSKYGPDKAKELIDAQENRPSSIGRLWNAINPWSSSKGSGPRFGGSRGGSDATPADQTPNGTLGEQRAKFSDELKNNPQLYDKILRIAANEQGNNPEGTQAVIESMMNRALVRGTTLEQQARWYGSENGGYYQMGNMGRGALEDPKWKSVLEDSYKKALGGSNISDYATDNASGNLAERESADGTFRRRQGYNGETFFAPGSAETGLASKWDKWQQGVSEAEARARQADPAQPTVAGSNQSKVARGSSTDQNGRPMYIGGMGYMEGFGKFHWGSGGVGRGSIPYGDYPVTPGAIGPWGQAHGAVGVNNGSIDDPKYPGAPRSGIEIHASSSGDLDRLYTEGCFSVPQAEWPAFKQHLLTEISKNGPMYLHVGRDGNASLTHSATATGDPANDPKAANVNPDLVQAPGGDKPKSVPQQAAPKQVTAPKQETLKDKFSDANMDAKDAAWFAKPGAPDANADFMSQVKSMQAGNDAANKSRQMTPDEAMKDPTIARAWNNNGAPPTQPLDDATPNDTSGGDPALAKTMADADVAKTDFSRAVPVPDTSTRSGEEITQDVKDSTTGPASRGSTTDNKSDTGSQGSGSKPGANERIAAPVNHPESEAPRPGSDGYGDQQHDPDDCGICSLH